MLLKQHGQHHSQQINALAIRHPSQDYDTHLLLLLPQHFVLFATIHTRLLLLLSLLPPTTPTNVLLLLHAGVTGRNVSIALR